LPGVAGIVTIEAPDYKPGTADTKNPKLDLEMGSIRDAEQAWALCKSTEQANKLRSERATMMELQYSGQPPFSPSGKINQAESWQSNVNTGILQGIVDQKTLQFTDAITDEIYLTRSALPTTWPDWKSKSDKFDIHTTRLIQGWQNYDTFVPNSAKENVLHGYGFAVFLDPRTWKPRFFKQDVAYVPDESPQWAGDLQFFVIRHDYLLHEFLDLFRDEEAAKAMGYNIENCVNAAAHSVVKDPKEDAVVNNFRKYADFIQDGALGITYAASGPRVVKTYLLWNREYDGQVSFWIIARDDGKLLRFAPKIYKQFQDVVTLFSFQPGNGHLHSSKGLGRMLIGNVVVAEKMRNKSFDETFMASMLLLRASSKDKNKLQPVVQAPFIVVDNSIEISATKMPANADNYVKMGEQIIGFIEQAAGAYINSTTTEGGQPQTATQVQTDATLAKQVEDITKARWRNQFMGLVQTMQIRANSDENLAEAQQMFMRIGAGEQETEEFYDGVIGDRDCIQYIVNMLKDGLSVEDIRILRRAPAKGYAHTDDAITSQGILAVKKAYTGNPNVDQVEMDKRVVEALAGPDAAGALIINKPDQTVVAEASRMQQSESAVMEQLLQPVAVSPRDNHLIHGEVCMGFLQILGPQISQLGAPDAAFKQAELNLNHLGSHLQNYLEKGGVTQDAQYKKLNDFYNTFKQQLTQAVQIHETQKVAAQMPTPELAQKVLAAGTNTPPPPPNGSAAVQGAVSSGQPMGEGVPAAGADMDFKSNALAAPPQPAAQQNAA
jgi:hypothetical protein